MIPDLAFLQTDKLVRRRGVLAPMPGLTHETGSIQMEADLCAVRHPIFPPVSGSGEMTGQVLFGDRQLCQLAPHVEMQWTAYAVERRVRYDDWELTSRTALLPNEEGFVVKWEVVNRSSRTRMLPFGLILSGRARNSGGDGYAWSVPEVPTDVMHMRDRIGLNIQISPGPIPKSLHFSSVDEPAHSMQAVSDGATMDVGEGFARWNVRVAPGKKWSGHYVAVYGASKAAASKLLLKWKHRIEEAFVETKRGWEELWQAAFTPGNAQFSGHMPVLESESEPLLKLYYNAILTLLCQRRRYAGSVLETAYLTLGQRRGEGSIYLSWDLPYIAPVLAKLDPDALFAHWQALCGAPLFSHMVLNLFDGKHTSFPCVGDPYARISPLHELRLQGKLPDLSGIQIPRSGKPVTGFLPNGEAIYGDDSAHSLSAKEAVHEAAWAHRKYHLPKSALVDFGDRGNYLECPTTYAHGTAAHTAVQIWAMESAGTILGQRMDRKNESAKLLDAVMSLYRAGDGFFDCLHRNGRRRPARNLYDIGLTLSMIGEKLPTKAVREMDRFVREHLATPTWARCIASFDPDSASGTRCDHQWAGCFVSWPGQYILGLKRAGYRPEWISEWVEGIAKITAQGPFAQAYFAEDVVEPECGGAVKAFDDLPQGNHWTLSSGAIYAHVVLDALLGAKADQVALDPWPGLGKEHRVTLQ